MGRRIMCSVAALGALGLCGSGVAHADEQGYLDYATNHGATVNGFTTPILLNAGHSMCPLLAQGQSPEQIGQTFFYPGGSPASVAMLARGAQQELCAPS
ncbi:DUF732 domain-containing protein [Mycobacterium avium subsp. hominissuis]|nr:DUF732 domain-containing protein [Mycobacterium avium subsp. hominissuis]MCA4741376.1 DUF732 domain-containing protein [Mycobacterium avium subsp. hominissuis]MCA4746195.1 DUF732 domain-containing protein [Mycobacterium avium subsp. hominissuis]QXD05763.1 DUF732 domain-containing protein [Mycobacterium avium subsp. hominissuis]UBV01033.1 DUF732 domain-containing protein [Mycobacterium avium subsp. hominissuis]